ncbi:hypothetical protein R3P38DRAFT_3371255 [Favolaschia claudopus]|uniref:Uncharacterized protein n=1 Tax=Favolaschia claudopus TaxID=2862362 RepID=A0AAV9ZYJ8_9AGAR
MGRLSRLSLRIAMTSIVMLIWYPSPVFKYQVGGQLKADRGPLIDWLCGGLEQSQSDPGRALTRPSRPSSVTKRPSDRDGKDGAVRQAPLQSSRRTAALIPYVRINKKHGAHLGTAPSNKIIQVGSPSPSDGTVPSVAVRRMSILKLKTDGVRPVLLPNTAKLMAVASILGRVDKNGFVSTRKWSKLIGNSRNNTFTHFAGSQRPIWPRKIFGREAPQIHRFRLKFGGLLEGIRACSAPTIVVFSLSNVIPTPHMASLEAFGWGWPIWSKATGIKRGNQQTLSQRGTS